MSLYFLCALFIELVGDGIMLLAVDCVLGVLNGPATLRVELADFLEFARVSAILSDELSGDCERLRGVHFELWTRSTECLMAKTHALNVKAILVTDILETIFTIVPTGSAGTSVVPFLTGVHCAGQ